MNKLLRSLLRWGIVLAIVFFISKTIYDNWQAVRQIQVETQAWSYAGAALGVALSSYIWLAVLWGWILENLKHSMPWHWTLGIYLTVDVAKYLPGNIWHLYGRVRMAQKAGIPVEIGTTSVFLDPLFVTAAGMGFSLLNTSHPIIQTVSGFGLICILIGIHPLVFEQILRWLGQIQHNPVGQRVVGWVTRQQKSSPRPVRLRRYPLKILLGEFLYMGLRCITFLLAISTFTSLSGKAIVPIIGGFSFAWALGLALPGFPGGLGIFEATTLTLLQELLAPGLLLGAIGLYRLVSVLAEVIGAGLGWYIRWEHRKLKKV